MFLKEDNLFIFKCFLRKTTYLYLNCFLRKTTYLYLNCFLRKTAYLYLNCFLTKTTYKVSQTKFGGLIVFAPFLIIIIIIKSPKQLFLLRFLLSLPNKAWGTYCFCSVSSSYYSYSYSYSSSSFFPCTMNLSTADLRNYRTEFYETWWSYRYMFLVDPKVFRFVVKGVKAIFLGVQRGWGLL